MCEMLFNHQQIPYMFYRRSCTSYSFSDGVKGSGGEDIGRTFRKGAWRTSDLQHEQK